MKTNCLALCPCCASKAYESHVSQCLPEAKSIAVSIRKALKDTDFICWCIEADNQGITGGNLVDLYRDNQCSTCETIIAVLARSIRDNRDPLVHAEFIRAFAVMRESITW